MTGFVNGIEGMEKLVLDLLLAGNELHVVHQQKISVAVLGTEFAAASRADQFNELVDEIVALDVDDICLWLADAHLMGNGIDQMGLAEAGVPVDKKRIVVIDRPVRYGARRSVGHFIRFAYDERFKCEIARFHQR